MAERDAVDERENGNQVGSDINGKISNRVLRGIPNASLEERYEKRK